MTAWHGCLGAHCMHASRFHLGGIAASGHHMKMATEMLPPHHANMAMCGMQHDGIATTKLSFWALEQVIPVVRPIHSGCSTGFTKAASTLSPHPGIKLGVPFPPHPILWT